MNGESTGPTPVLSGIVVHWHNEEALEELVASWPEDERFELLIVDNGSRRPLSLARGRRLESPGNLGFAGAVNLGVEASRAPLVLLLNPDAHPLPGALEALIEGFSEHPEAAGVAPRLLGLDGAPQASWQLRKLPSLAVLWAECLLLPGSPGIKREPEAGARVEQPAAAALALRRSILIAVGGMDETFYPAWFEDVDLAHRLADRGERILYWPDAEFEHGLGFTVPELGYPQFLWIYQRNLDRYLRKHFGAFNQTLGRCLRTVGAVGRAIFLPFRRPRRAASRSEALEALADLLLGTLSGWRWPRSAARMVEMPKQSPADMAVTGALDD